MMNEKQLKAEIFKAENHLEELNKLSMSEDVNPLELPEIDIEIEAMKDWVSSLYNDLYEVMEEPQDEVAYGTFGVTVRG